MKGPFRIMWQLSHPVGHEFYVLGPAGRCFRDAVNGRTFRTQECAECYVHGLKDSAKTFNK